VRLATCELIGPLRAASEAESAAQPTAPGAASPSKAHRARGAKISDDNLPPISPREACRPGRCLPAALMSNMASSLDEREQLVVDPILKGCAHAMRRTLVDHELSVFDDFRRHQGGGADRHNLVIVTMQD
jgi:hypothetical protein